MTGGRIGGGKKTTGRSIGSTGSAFIRGALVSCRSSRYPAIREVAGRRA
jgi:hypothetical protein